MFIARLSDGFVNVYIKTNIVFSMYSFVDIVLYVV